MDQQYHELSEQEHAELLRMAELAAQRLVMPLSAEDEAELEQWLDAVEGRSAMLEAAMHGEQVENMVSFVQSIPVAKRLEVYQRQLVRERRTRILRWTIPAAAALAIGFLFFFYNPERVAAPPGQVNAVTDQSNGVVLVLDDGQEVVLGGKKDTTIQSGAVVRIQEGEAIYSGQGSDVTGFHTLRTPAGRTFRLTLADGSRVMLNAGSEIRFAPKFGNEERAVQVRGEAYFEVSADVSRPFTVSTDDGLKVTVLGTNFNIRAYADEGKGEATLLTGKVKVSDGVNERLLLPGHSALSDGRGGLQVRKVDTLQLSAWRHNRFAFKDAPLADVLKEVGHWYGVSFDPGKGFKPDEPFSGMMDRSLTLEKVLSFIHSAGACNFVHDGKEIKVTAYQP